MRSEPRGLRDVLLVVLLLLGLLGRGVAVYGVVSPLQWGLSEALSDASEGQEDAHNCGCATASMCAGGCCCDPASGFVPPRDRDTRDRDEGPCFSRGCGGSPSGLPLSAELTLSLETHEVAPLLPPPNGPVWHRAWRPNSRVEAPSAPPPESPVA